MTTFLAILKTNYQRTLTRIVPYIVITILSMASILFGSYLSNQVQTFAHIAVVDNHTALTQISSSALIKVTMVDEKIPRSDLYEQKYDACLFVNEQGTLTIDTLKSAEYITILQTLLDHPDAPITGNYKQRSSGESIIGFMLMFLLMISFSNLSYFADDKEQGQLTRIITAPVSFISYISANLIYSLSMFLPQFLLLVVMKQAGISIGLQLHEFLFFIIIIGFLGSSFALLLFTLIQKPDNANMLGNSVTMLTSILGGAFYSFSKNNTLLDTMIKVIPQKQILTFAAHLESNQGHVNYLPMLYFILLAVTLFFISCMMLRKKYVKGA